MTNEEIEKALYANYDKTITDWLDCYGVLSYINRLKAEIAGLTGALEAARTDNGNLTRTLEEANDELKDIRKDTAKEILTALCEPMDVWTETEDLEKSEQRKIGGILFVKKANERIKEIAKRYGVEVD